MFFIKNKLYLKGIYYLFFIFYLLNLASFMGAFFIKKPPAELVA
nr:MAG TPA: hypothetical protein [Caudoviricetes sp.]